MNDSYLTAGIRATPLLRLLTRNQISWTLKNTGRILFLLQSSCWSSLFSRIEQIRYRQALKNSPVPKDPIFIVGHWRTGSTFLHQLMNRDPNLTTPTLYQVALPDHFLTSYHFYKCIFAAFAGKSRPMDNVKIGIDEPQEDEYAMYRLTTFSPLEKLVFPADREYFLANTAFLPDNEKLQDWTSSLASFYRKILYATGKRIVSKNPFNSLRIPLLAELFPEARFIHIVRHPYNVVPSTRHLWTVIQKQNILNKNSYTPDAQEISVILDNMMTTIQCDYKKLPGNQTAEIRYEDLDKDPKGILSDLYAHFDLPFTTSFENSLDQFISQTSGFQKNTYSITEDEKNVIKDIMFSHIERYQYLENA
ncbi:MAG: sulfotransferase [Bacteroidales bacterium]|nr:sulfotransferase [Bacteroidota bacterium]MBL6949524.1 sulfotransferase [Bacteroidales bacterium]